MASEGDFGSPRLSWVLTPEPVEERLLKVGIGNEDAGGDL